MAFLAWRPRTPLKTPPAQDDTSGRRPSGRASPQAGGSPQRATPEELLIVPMDIGKQIIENRL